jgi:uncharacterized damage-inducible protein DinB
MGKALPTSAAVKAMVAMHCLSFTVTPRAGLVPRESLSLGPMDVPLGGEFLDMVRHRMLDEYPGQIRACLDALGEDDLWWRPHEQANAAGNLVLHLAGSNQFYLGHAIGGEPDTRDRDAEFGARGEPSTADVFGAYERARVTVQRVLDTLTPARLVETTMATGRSSSFARILMHVTHHNALHIGQIVWVTKLRKPGALHELLRGGQSR